MCPAQLRGDVGTDGGLAGGGAGLLLSQHKENEQEQQGAMALSRHGAISPRWDPSSGFPKEFGLREPWGGCSHLWLWG